MSENRKIDFSKLLGFQIMRDELAERVDFQAETLPRGAGRQGSVWKDDAPQYGSERSD